MAVLCLQHRQIAADPLHLASRGWLLFVLALNWALLVRREGQLYVCTVKLGSNTTAAMLRAACARV